MKAMKVISIKKERILIFIYLLIIAIGLAHSFNNEAITTFTMPVNKKVIVIDAGHGGWDPGKVGEGNVLEKEINLQIAKKLQAYLEQGGSYVLMTRIEDEALSTKKTWDMNLRKGLANTNNADLFISIHQNSFPNSNVKGAQVFYYNQSDKSKDLAVSIQKELKDFVDYSNKLEAKSNENYYVLKQTKMPAVIVECGFLTNPRQRMNLINEDYQDRIAWAIYMGIVKYFDTESQS